MSRHTLENQVRRVRRPPIPPEQRDRVLRAAAAPVPDAGMALPDLSPGGTWRFLAVAAALVIVLAAALWQARPQPGEPFVTGERRVEAVKSPGDDVVVFWVDDETPVFVDLLGR